MNEIDRDLFIFVMKRNNYDIKALAQALNMSVPNVYHKLNGKIAFSLAELKTIKRLWNLSAEQFDKIFLTLNNLG